MMSILTSGGMIIVKIVAVKLFVINLLLYFIHA